MNPRSLGHPLSAGELEQRYEMVDVRVDASTRDETEEMDVASALPGAGECPQESWVVEERAVPHRGVHAHQILERDSAGPDCQMPHLGVSHLTFGQPDGFPGRGELGVRVPGPERVECRSRGKLHGVARPGRSEAPTVEHDERYERDAAV